MLTDVRAHKNPSSSGGEHESGLKQMDMTAIQVNGSSVVNQYGGNSAFL